MRVGKALYYTAIERGNQYLLLRSEYIPTSLHPGICPKEIAKDVGKDLSTNRSERTV